MPLLASVSGDATAMIPCRFLPFGEKVFVSFSSTCFNTGVKKSAGAHHSITIDLSLSLTPLYMCVCVGVTRSATATMYS